MQHGSRTKSVSGTATLEALDHRVLFASAYYSIDGTGNNLTQSTWGATGTAQIRYAPAAYGDGISTAAGTSRPSARAISNAVSAQTTTEKNDRNLSEFIWVFGQFIDHDIDLTNSGTESLNIAVPKGDPYFDPTGTGTATMSLKRSLFDAATGTSKSNPRQQINAITSWIDGSMIYGSDAATAKSLRAFVGGKLKTSAGDLLPIGADGFFQAGDVRASENVVLTSMQIVWLREHNKVADRLAKAHSTWNDEKLFQEARKYVVAELQAVTFNEFLPALLGPNALKPYAGYNPKVNPSIANEFSTAIFRFGHSTLGDDIDVLDNNGNDLAEPYDLSEVLFNNAPIKEHGIDPFLKYAASSNAAEVDTQVTDQLRNFLFGAPGQGGLDLVSLNIQRGRDHGLADYNTLRATMGLARVTDFSQITSDSALAAQLKTTYGDVNNIDAWVGALAEDHLPGASVGPLASRMIADQFSRLRAGDRLWYENTYSGAALDALKRTRLSDIIERNSSLTTVQNNAFVFDVDVSGTVFADGNRNGTFDLRDPRLPRLSIDLLDADGEVVATTTTNRDGAYRFNDVNALGTFTVRIPAAGVTKSLLINTSGTLSGVNIATTLRAPQQLPQQPPRQPQARIAQAIFSTERVVI